MASMHEVDYQILGDDMQFVKIELDPGEAAIGEAGAMMYLEDGIEVQTIFGDGTQQTGGVMGALMGAGKRLLVGESLFMSVFRCETATAHLALANPIAGKIIPIQLNNTTILAERNAYLCAIGNVDLTVAFTKRFGAGLFGGAGTLALYEKARDLAKQLGMELPHASAGGGSDANFTGAMGIPTLDGLGVRGADPHTLNEHIVVESLAERGRLMAGLLATLE